MKYVPIEAKKVSKILKIFIVLNASGLSQSATFKGPTAQKCVLYSEWLLSYLPKCKML